ncbi:MAG: hypothetical protein ACTMH4_02260 [Sphingobacterium sp.]
MSKQHSIRIKSIYCGGTSGDKGTSSDELYLVCQSDAGIPVRVPAGFNKSYSMQKGKTWELDLVLGFDYEVLVTLWDHDLPFDPNTADYLQSYDFVAGSGSGSTKPLKNLDGAEYTINFTYID